MESIGDYWENSPVWLWATSYYGFLQNRNYSDERGKINLLLQCHGKQTEKVLVLRENQWSPLLRNFQQILVLLMPLSLVLSLEQATMPEIASHL